MYSIDHFHSTSQEVLAIASGQARCSFGHLENPERVERVLGRGDVVIIPAGVSHRLVEVVERPFQMVGCYPEGLDWDMCYAGEGEKEGGKGKIEASGKLPWLRTDPVYGEGGPAMEI